MDDATHCSNKELQAVARNIKQDRILEKTIHTIQLEKLYAVKLLHLGDREVKLKQSNLKSRVSKIKSFLQPNEIKEMRELEMQGKLKPMYKSLNLNTAMRIAATARRLKMDPDGQPLYHNTSATSSAGLSRPTTTTTTKSVINQNRCSSVPRIFIDETDQFLCNSGVRRYPTKTASCNDLINDRTKFLTNPTKSLSPPLSPRVTSKTTYRPISSNGFGNINGVLDKKSGKTLRPKSCISIKAGSVSPRRSVDDYPHVTQDIDSPTCNMSVSVNEKSNRIRTEYKDTKTGKTNIPLLNIIPATPVTEDNTLNLENAWAKSQAGAVVSIEKGRGQYDRASSPRLDDSRIQTEGIRHAIKHVQSSGAQTERSNIRSPRNRILRRHSSFSLGSFDREQAKERMKEAIHDRIEGEQCKAEEIQKKKRAFMKKVNRWVEENPSLVKDNDGPYTGQLGPKQGKPKLVSEQLVEGDSSYKDKNSNNETGSLNDQFKDLRKCRYLRIPDSKADFSGVSTLVRDQLNTFRSSLREPIWEERSEK